MNNRKRKKLLKRAIFLETGKCKVGDSYKWKENVNKAHRSIKTCFFIYGVKKTVPKKKNNLNGDPPGL